MRVAYAPAGRRDAATAVALARQAEELGFAEVWLSEDYLERGAFAVAGAVAASTSRVGIGLGVINPWTRHVALTAMECAALDEVSGGRLVVGIGASNQGWMEGRLGIPFAKPISTLATYSRALRELLAGKVVRGDVNGHDLDAALSFTPARRDVPVYWGVKGERALAAGAEAADGLMLSVLSTPAYVRWIRAQHPRPGLRLTGYAAFSCDEDGALARDRVRSRTARFLGMHGASPITSVPGLPAERATALRERMLAGADGADLVDDDLLRTFTLAGTPDDVAAGMGAFADAGLDTLVVMDDGVSPAAEALDRAAACARRAGLLG
ncbi:LLM class flavin-dependent oxidoreductase [Cellulomonas sp. Marseille-Q8402]